MPLAAAFSTLFHLAASLLLLPVLAAAVYLWGLALASRRTSPKPASLPPRHRFAIAIPAHNEAEVIGHTVQTLRQMDYSPDLFTIYVVADHCSDNTAAEARGHGALCFERTSGPRGGKSSALLWLFEKIFAAPEPYDAIVVFDADTQVDKDFLQVMNSTLGEGSEGDPSVVQGRHVISNPAAGWFPALSWTLMAIDNRFSNQGRENLKLCAKNMGDSICFRTQVLRELGWGSGLTEDYEFRLKLILAGLRIAYQPWAIGYGQAALTWKEAQAQHTRWRKGVLETGRNWRASLFRHGLQRKDPRLLDAVISSLIPSYSTLTLVSVLMLLFSLAAGLALPHPGFGASLAGTLVLPTLWAALAALFFVYPFYGLAVERAPVWAFQVTLSGPLFLLWRTWLGIRIRLTKGSTTWVKTTHRS